MVVSLRAFSQIDAIRLADMLHEPEVHQFLLDQMPFPYTLEHARKYIDFAYDNFPLDCAIHIDGDLAGCINLTEKGDIYRINLEIGYWLGKKYWGRGAATQAVIQMTRNGFRQIGIERIFANVFSVNVASSRVLEKSGFILEGNHRRCLIKRGEIFDCSVYAITRDRWEELERLRRYKQFQV